VYLVVTKKIELDTVPIPVPPTPEPGTVGSESEVGPVIYLLLIFYTKYKYAKN